MHLYGNNLCENINFLTKIEKQNIKYYNISISCNLLKLDIKQKEKACI
jgi:hypothetical protein